MTRSPSPRRDHRRRSVSRDRDRDRERDRDRQRRREKDKDKERNWRRGSRERHERSEEVKRRRNRSDSVPRGRSRSRSRSRSLRRTRSRSRGRSRSRSGCRYNNRSPSKARNVKKPFERPPITEADLVGKTEDEQEMLKAMGFCAFDSTKGKPVPGNKVGAVHVILKRKYRQYMNRKGGFNRPLDFVA